MRMDDKLEIDDEFRCKDCGGFDSYGTITDRLCGCCKEKRRKKGETIENENTKKVGKVS